LVSVLSEVGKKLAEIYHAMLDAYAAESNKESAAKNALDIYYRNRSIIEEIRRVLDDIEDLRRVLEDSLKEIAEQRAKQEATARRIKSGGCIVAKLVPCGKNCRGCPHGPYLYRVVKIGGKQKWIYLGKAHK